MEETHYYEHGSINNFKDLGRTIKQFFVDTTERPIARCKVVFRCRNNKKSNENSRKIMFLLDTCKT